MERGEMVIALLVVLLAIAVLQTIQIFGMYSESNQVRAALGSQLQSASGSNIVGIQQPVQQPASQGIGGC